MTSRQSRIDLSATATDGSTRPLRIGFIDHDLNNYHAETYLAQSRATGAPGASVTACTALKADEGRAWAAKHDVPYFDTVAAMDSHVDAYAVLAPSNPELHLSLCQSVLPSGKPTFVDKTFAPDADTAEQIFALADRYGTPIQTSSALRYTNVQAHVAKLDKPGPRHMVAWGGGRSFDEYAIHPVELVISCMGPAVQRLMLRRTGADETQLLLDFAHGRTAVINVYTNTDTPFATAVTDGGATSLLTVDTSRLFTDAWAGTVRFFMAGSAQVDRRETLAVMRILDAAHRTEAASQWVTIDADRAADATA